MECMPVGIRLEVCISYMKLILTMANHLVIMAGGVGSRFWPLSTSQCPKQFIDITGSGRTMIQQTLDRFEGIIDRKQVWVVTSEHYKELVLEQLEGINLQHVLLEPCMRNTAPCVAYVSWKILKEDEDAQIVVAPSDHLVLDIPAFQKAIQKGYDFLNKECGILTLGIKPSRPDIGYGYIKVGEETGNGVHILERFCEKPELPVAINYFQSGQYVWNSGMFMWSVKTIVGEIRKYTPEIAMIMDNIAPSLFSDKEQAVVNELFPTCPKISIDYAVMENTDLAYVEPVEFGWSDLGTWGSLYTLKQHDEAGNAVMGEKVAMFESEGCLVKVPQHKKVVIQGLKDCIVAEHDDTLLICQLKEEQHIKDWHN